jgi:predicted RNA binding protein YcfA (HicA-like mRNA interferase family)
VRQENIHAIYAKAYGMTLNTKQAKTLEAIYARPTRATIKWTDIVNLFKACGAEVVQRQGSRVCVKLGDQRAVFHAPHPHKETVKGAVEDIRAFLQRAGIRP